MSIDELAERVGVAIYQYQLADNFSSDGPDPDLGRHIALFVCGALLDEPKLLMPVLMERTKGEGERFVRLVIEQNGAT